MLVVDDSIVFRSAISSALEQSKLASEIQVASNGQRAVDFLKSKKFDVVILDLEMPIKDGLKTLEEIREFDRSIIVIIFAAASDAQAKKTMTALDLGADDFVAKVEGGSNLAENIEMIGRELIPRIKALKGRGKLSARNSGNCSENLSVKMDAFKVCYPELLAIASSTGGPDALRTLVSELPKTMNVPIVIVQHIPAVFSKQLAKMLDSISHYTVVEAKDGDIVQKNYCYIAPGDYHMELIHKDTQNIIKLNQQAKECYVRPAANVLLRSIAPIFKKKLLVLVLTGMGEDALLGVEQVKEYGGKVVIQDEASSVVWGMPGAIAARKLEDAIVPLLQMPKFLEKMGERL